MAISNWLICSDEGCKLVLSEPNPKTNKLAQKQLVGGLIQNRISVMQTYPRHLQFIFKVENELFFYITENV